MFGSVKPSPAALIRAAFIFRVSPVCKRREWQMPFPSFGPSGETRTRGILLPKRDWNFFLTLSTLFWHFLFQKTCSLKLLPPLYPNAPKLNMVNNVVKNRFPHNSGSGSFIQRICSKQYCQGDCIICCTQVVNAFTCSGRIAQK